MAVEEVEVYEHEGGVCVDPKSDTKVVFIPSPPTKMEQKTNPRPAIILFGCDDAESLKAKADEEKVVFVLPKDAEPRPSRPPSSSPSPAPRSSTSRLMHTAHRQRKRLNHWVEQQR